jgi:CHASE3 domain sensor protein
VHTLTQRRLSLLGFGLAGLLLLAVGWLSYVQMVRLGRARDLATHTLLVRGEIEVILSLVKDAETGSAASSSPPAHPDRRQAGRAGPHLDLRRRLGYVAAARVVTGNSGQRIMDDIRVVAGAMLAEEGRLYAERNAALAREARLAMLVNVGRRRSRRARPGEPGL